MTAKTETKHERFLRLAHGRLERAKNKLRLILRLSSERYENTPNEVEEIVRILDKNVRHIAEVLGVEYATRIGKAVSQTTNGVQPVNLFFRKAPVVDEIECMKALEHLRAGRIEEVEKFLRSAVIGKAT